MSDGSGDSIDSRVYEVFARKERKDALAHIGTIRGANRDLACVYARSTYDEENWVEMVLVPRTAIVTAQRVEPLVDIGSADAAESDSLR